MSASTRKQLDLECVAAEEGLGRGIGGVPGDTYTSPFTGVACTFPNHWYGGRVQFSGKFEEQKDSGLLHLKLQRPKLGKSCQFSRLVLSENLITIKAQASERFSEKESRFLEETLMLFMGKAFRLFCAKDQGKAYVAAFREENKEARSGKPTLSYIECIRLINHPTINDNQASNTSLYRFEQCLTST
jgi:hypothetical protein